MQKEPIAAIRTLVGCGASGASLLPGTAYAVPAQVSEKDARILIRIKKAVEISADECKAAQAKAAKEAKAAQVKDAKNATDGKGATDGNSNEGGTE